MMNNLNLLNFKFLIKFLKVLVFKSIIFSIISCTLNNKENNVKKREIVVFNTKEYNARRDKFSISLKEAYKLAYEFNKGYPFGDHYFIVNEDYVFSTMADKVGSISISGTYVNGNTGVTKFVNSDNHYNKNHKDWPKRFSLKGLVPATKEDLGR